VDLAVKDFKKSEQQIWRHLIQQNALHLRDDDEVMPVSRRGTRTEDRLPSSKTLIAVGTLGVGGLFVIVGTNARRGRALFGSGLAE